ncbi:MAG: hypothetical protein JO020_08785 [Chloroflexi bacterium]|nr:hypothetical protein [Chloroflexota bacterium]
MNLRKLRTPVFTFFAGLFALASLLMLEGLTEGLLPWITLGCPGCPEDATSYPLDMMRWHGAVHGALLGVLFTGALVGLLWRARERPLLLQFYVLGHLTLIAGFLPFRPASTPPGQMIAFSIEVIITLVLMCALYPAPRQLFSFSAAASSPRLIASAVASAAIMGAIGLQHLQWQLAGFGGASASESRWAESVILSVCLIFASVLAATRNPGWQALGLITSLAYIYLGIAAISVPDQPGSWGLAGGIAATAGGLVYGGLIVFESRQPHRELELAADPATA